jgi:VWFA-related protein
MRILPAVAAWAVVLPGLLSSPAVVAQQNPTPQVPELLAPVSTELVRVDVVVTQKSGGPRVGLSQDDFVILEDGQPQKITQFEAFVSAPPKGAPPAPGTPTPDADASEPVRKVPPTRYVVLAVDDVHMEARNLIRIKKALDRFLEKEIGPEDQVALVNTSGSPKLVAEFTDDRQALRRTIDRLSVQDRTIGHTGVPNISEYQAEQIERGDETALDVAVQEIMADGTFQDQQSATAFALSISRHVHTESVYYGRMTLETLEGVVSSLSELQGRRVLALFSDGFLAGLSNSSTPAYDIRKIADAGTRAGVVVYAMDTRGLVATPTNMTASARVPVLTSTFGTRDAISRQGEIATRDVMNAVSADTGGFMVENTNDLNSGLRRILKDTETYYAVAYEPSNAKRDGSFRKIEVKVKEPRDLKVRARKGYFAPDERRLASLRQAPPPAAAPSQKPDAAAEAKPPEAADPLRKALTSPVPARAIPVHLSADFVRLDEDLPQLVVSSNIDLRAVPFAHEQERHLATVAAGAMVFDEAGALVGTLEPQRMAMDLSDESLGRALRNGLAYQKAAPVKPGRYRVRVAAVDEGTGKVGTASQWIEVPQLDDGRFRLSSLFLLKKEDRPAPAASDGPTLRGVQTQPRYRQGEDLYMQLYAYNPKRDAAGTTSLLAQAEVWRKGALLASSPPEPIVPGEQEKARVEHTRSIKLRAFEPGDYEVRLVITDKNAQQVASRRADFTIE